MKKIILLLILLITLPVYAREEQNIKKPTSRIDVSLFSSLNDAVNSPESTGKTIVISSIINCNNLTIPNGKTIEIKKGGVIRYSGHLHIDAPFQAGRHQTFQAIGNGLVTFGQSIGAKIHPEWFGAVANDSIDCTLAIKKAFAAGTSNYSVIFSPGIYRIGSTHNDKPYASIILSGKSNLTVDGNGATIKQMDAKKRIFQFDSCTNVKFSNLNTYGLFQTHGASGTEAHFYMGAAVGDNVDMIFDNIHALHNSSNVFYVGSIKGGLQKNIRITNCTMKQGLSFLLSYGAKGLLVENITIEHKNTAQVDPGLSQDVDIDIESYNGISVENATVNNITIDAGGSATNPYVGGVKVTFVCWNGLTMKNIAVSNIKILNNIGNYSPINGSQAASLSILDSNPSKSNISNATFTNINTFNSMGIFIEAQNIHFSKISLDTFTSPKSFSDSYGYAIYSSQAVSNAGCIFKDIVVKNWKAARTISLAQGNYRFDGLKVQNSSSGIFAANSAIYNNMIIDNVGNATHGAFFVSGATPNIVISNSVFRNNPHVALKDNAMHHCQGATMSNVTFSSNTSNTDILTHTWKVTGANGL